MDPLSDILSLMKPRSYVSGGLDLGGDWSVTFPRHEGMKCYALAAGSGWLQLEGQAEAVRLEPRDCFLLPHGRPFRLASDPRLPTRPWTELERRDGMLRAGDGGGCLILGAHFTFAGGGGALLDLLPPVVHVREEADRTALCWSLKRLREELTDPQPGGALVAEHLAHMILIQALRLHLGGDGRGAGWLFALADRRMAAALGALHAEPEQAWTVEALAAEAGMSRSTFALRFRDAVGTAPMAYLANWRMRLAEDQLARGGASVGEVARSLGYRSESAFSTAFRRVKGRPPRGRARARA